MRRFFRWLLLDPQHHVGELEAVRLETASLRHLADSLEKERDDALAELKCAKSDLEQVGHYGKASRQEALAAYQHLGRLLSWTHPSHLPATKDGKS